MKPRSLSERCGRRKNIEPATVLQHTDRKWTAQNVAI